MQNDFPNFFTPNTRYTRFRRVVFAELFVVTLRAKCQINDPIQLNKNRNCDSYPDDVAHEMNFLQYS